MNRFRFSPSTLSIVTILSCFNLAAWAASPPVFSSPATASANPAGTGQLITFSATATSSLTLNYSWAFGDGTSAQGASVQHSYSTPGSFTAILTASDGSQSVTSSVVVIVNAPVVTMGYMHEVVLDSDGDGFSDLFETTFHYDPLSTNSPFGTTMGVTKAALVPLSGLKAKLKLNFSDKKKNMGKLSFHFPVPDGTTMSGLRRFNLLVCGIPKVFIVMDGKGFAIRGKSTIKITVKKTRAKSRSRAVNDTTMLSIECEIRDDESPVSPSSEWLQDFLRFLALPPTDVRGFTFKPSVTFTEGNTAAQSTVDGTADRKGDNVSIFFNN